MLMDSGTLMWQRPKCWPHIYNADNRILFSVPWLNKD
jgi:hypothetical protein